MSVFDRIIQIIRKITQDKTTPITIDKEEEKKERQIEEIHSIWDYIKFNEHSQAHHLCSILGFDEWTDMEEIFRRIKDIFNAEYKNERSLYPYIKTLVDCGLVEATAVGGKRKWRKKEVIIKLSSTQKAKITSQLTTEIKG